MAVVTSGSIDPALSTTIDPKSTNQKFGVRAALKSKKKKPPQPKKKKKGA